MLDLTFLMWLPHCLIYVALLAWLATFLNGPPACLARR